MTQYPQMYAKSNQQPPQLFILPDLLYEAKRLDPPCTPSIGTQRSNKATSQIKKMKTISLSDYNKNDKLIPLKQYILVVML